jgi:L-asparaginase/Glu-tRNA(Gln) amidotransferase subunit D
MTRHAISTAAVMAFLLTTGTTIAAGGGSTVGTSPANGASATAAACSAIHTGTTITWSRTGTWIATRHVDQTIRLNLADGIR